MRDAKNFFVKKFSALSKNFKHNKVGACIAHPRGKVYEKRLVKTPKTKFNFVNIDYLINTADVIKLTQ